MRAWWLTLAVVVLAIGSVACTNYVGRPPDAGTIGAEGEGEGEGEGEAEGEGESECSPDPVIGLVVVARDSLTQFSVCDATVTINNGPFSETLTPRPATQEEECHYASSPDLVGVFDIIVTHPAYAQGGLTDIEVLEDECGHAVFRRVVVGLDAP